MGLAISGFKQNLIHRLGTNQRYWSSSILRPPLKLCIKYLFLRFESLIMLRIPIYITYRIYAIFSVPNGGFSHNTGLQKH